MNTLCKQPVILADIPRRVMKITRYPIILGQTTTKNEALARLFLHFIFYSPVKNGAAFFIKKIQGFS